MGALGGIFLGLPPIDVVWSPSKCSLIWRKRGCCSLDSAVRGSRASRCICRKPGVPCLIYHGPADFNMSLKSPEVCMMSAHSYICLSVPIHTDLLSSPSSPHHHKSYLGKLKRWHGYCVGTDLRLKRPVMNKWEEIQSKSTEENSLSTVFL